MVERRFQITAFVNCANEREGAKKNGSQLLSEEGFDNCGMKSLVMVLWCEWVKVGDPFELDSTHLLYHTHRQCIYK